MSLAYLKQESTDVHPDDIWALSWMATNRLVSGCADGHLRIYDPLELSAPLFDIAANPLAITSLSASGDGKRLLASSLDGSVTLTDVLGGNVIGRVETGRSAPSAGEKELPAYACALHPESKCWAWSGRASKIGIRSISSEALEANGQGENGNDEEGAAAQVGEGTLAGEGRVVESGKGKFGMALQFSPDGRSLAMSTESGNIVVVDTESREVVANYQSHAMAVRTISWSADSQWLFSGSDDHRIVLHDVRAGSKSGSGEKGQGAVAIMQGHTSWVLDVAASPDARLLGSGGADSTVKLWDIGTRSAVFSSNTDGAVWAFEWQPPDLGLGTGKTFAVAGDEKVVSSYRAAGSV